MGRRGFSLVELSIVLVILGLLTGGILAGQSLIRAAALRSIHTDVGRYRTAVAAFKDKYLGLPGDVTNATAFWGAADGSTGLTTACTQSDTAATSAATCNGNGDGQIGASAIATACTERQYERYRLWQHLQNTGLVEGNLAGTHYVGGPAVANGCRGSIVGYNVPASKVDRGGFAIHHDFQSAPSLNSGGVLNNKIWFGATFSNGTAYIENLSPVLTSEETWNIDTKMDDGMPLTGKMISYNSAQFGSLNCATGASLTSRYDLQSSGPQCFFHYQLGL